MATRRSRLSLAGLMTAVALLGLGCEVPIQDQARQSLASFVTGVLNSAVTNAIVADD